MIAPESVSEAYKYCRKVTVKFAKTFYFASIFLPGPKRDACYAVYAFCRYLDDLVDENIARGGGAVDRSAIDRTIARWRSDLDRVYAGEAVATPVMTAWGDTLRRFRISRSLPDELIEGVMSDLRPVVRFDTFEELRDYCYKVASVVGLMTSEIFGYRDPRALGHAVDLGIAMQLTNILRDINEDFADNRVYIPREELERFGIDEGSIGEKRVCDAFRRLMRFQIVDEPFL